MGIVGFHLVIDQHIDGVLLPCVFEEIFLSPALEHTIGHVDGGQIPAAGAGTHRKRITVTRQFSRFLLRLGYSAYVPDSTLAARTPSTFMPRMLTDEELRKFFQAVDALEPTGHSPLRHLIMPEVFRLLYGC